VWGECGSGMLETILYLYEGEREEENKVKVGNGPKSQNGVKMGPKWGQNGAKMGPKWGQNGAKMGPKWGQNGAKMGPKWGQNGGLSAIVM
jgi:hypothetical protein